MNSNSEEFQRLARHYATLSDGELEQLDDRAHSLTAVAREALDAELARRDMQAKERAEKPQDDSLVFENLVTIEKFRDLVPALMAKGLLESAGIPCHLGNENIVRMDWFISNFVGGVQLRVAAKDEAAARGLLAEPTPEHLDFEEHERFEQPRCPKCHSLDISFSEIDKAVGYMSSYVGIPIPLKARMWNCATCGRKWREDGEAEE